MSSIKELQASMAAMMSRFESLTTENAAMKADIAALKEVGGKKRTTKPKSSSSSDGEKEEKKPRVSKPSEAKDAWRFLCDAVRAMHKKDAMKIAKILKDAGHMKPSGEQIEAAIKAYGDGKAVDVTMESAAYTSEVEVVVEKKPKKRSSKAKKEEKEEE